MLWIRMILANVSQKIQLIFDRYFRKDEKSQTLNHPYRTNQFDTKPKKMTKKNLEYKIETMRELLKNAQYEELYRLHY